MDMPDSYISKDLPMSEERKSFFRMVYGTDMDTQPICSKCGRPMYYRFDKKTGGSEPFCEFCGP